MRQRYAARKDANQTEIVEALIAEGASVYVIGLPVDLLIGVNGVTVPVEIKDGSKSPSRRKHTELQQKFMATWKGGPVATICDVESARRLVSVTKGGQ